MSIERKPLVLEEVAAWVLGLLWIIPLLFAVWAAVHPARIRSAVRARGTAYLR